MEEPLPMTLSDLPACVRRLALPAALAAAALATGCAGLQAPESSAEPVAAEATAAVATVAAPAVAAARPAATASAPVTLAPLQPRTRLDPEQDAERTDLWERVRRGYALPPLEGELVAKWEQWYASRPDYVQRMTDRGGRYLFHIIEEVERRGMPSELALLPFVESAYNPQAVSNARASGMWQFMPATGKDFELRQNLFRDDRRAVLESTRAALDYLQQLYSQFGDWHLALAAYNWGQGNVQRAINRNRSAQRPTDYASLRMPDETRNYVPKLQAVMNLVASPEAYGLQLPQLENHPYFLTVAIDRDIDVALAASLAGLPLDDFHALNPQHNKPVILAAGTPEVLLPYDNANRFLRGLAQHRGPLASWTAWVAPRTVNAAEAARLVGMGEAELREVNRIPARMMVQAGSTLLVPRNGHTGHDVAESIAHNAVMSLTPEPPPHRRVVVKAGAKGESVAAVARRYRVSASDVAKWNQVGTQARFKPGQQIVLLLPPKSATRASSVKRKPSPKRAAKPAAGSRSARPASR
jgi:membrane-bound lytic murein transglycosylase D